MNDTGHRGGEDVAVPASFGMIILALVCVFAGAGRVTGA